MEPITSIHLDDIPCIANNGALAGWNWRISSTRCLLIVSKRGCGGILVDSEGHQRVRYAAFVRNVGRLELNQVPVELYPARPTR